MPALLCKADKVEVLQNSGVALNLEWGSRSNHLKKTLDVEGETLKEPYKDFQ